MDLKLTIYTNDEMTEVKRIAEADRLKIPYRVAIYIGQSLETLNLKNDSDILNFVGGNVDYLDKIIKATFGVSELELECIDAGELGTVAVELYKWGIDKLNSMRGGNSKNLEATT